MENLLSIVSSLILTAAQAGAVPQDAPTVFVLGTQLRVVADYAADARRTRAASRASALGTPSLSESQRATSAAFDRLDAAADARAGRKYRVSIVLMNDGPRAVRAVTWSAAFVYSRGPSTPERRLFRVRREVKSGETRVLSHDFATSEGVTLKRGERAAVESVEYDDGTVWRRP